MDLAPATRRGFLLGILTSSIFLGQFFSPIAAAPSIAAVGLAETFALIGYLSAAIGTGFLIYGIATRHKADRTDIE